ncbi:MAG: hypothetical protein L7F78_16545 [Syntrophales bacterium LBB04]|nr:hypothetical protein [Syntrophales bacterium LBB04]
MSRSNRKTYVNIYCKIYAENFSNEMIDRYATGKEIYNFLMKDAGLCLPQHGDCNLWYLGSNEKFGNIIYKDKSWNWSFGEASFDIVKEFVRAVYDDGLFTEEQYRKLSDKIKEGRKLKDMYFIGEYLYQKNKPTTNTGMENSYVI